MPTKKLPRWAGPVALIGTLAVILYFSNQTAPLPQGFGNSIMNDAEYDQDFQRAKDLSESEIATYEAGQALTPKDMANLRQAGDLMDRMDAYRPLMATLFFSSGQIHHILGEDEIAEERFRQCVLGMDRQVADQPKYAPVLKATQAEAAYQLSMLLIDRRDFNGALEQATLAVKTNPQDSRYHTARGSALNELRRTDEAKKELQTAVRLDPRNSRAASLLKFISH